MGHVVKLPNKGYNLEVFEASFRVQVGKEWSEICYFDRNNPTESATKIADALLEMGKLLAKKELRQWLGLKDPIPFRGE